MVAVPILRPFRLLRLVAIVMAASRRAGGLAVQQVTIYVVAVALIVMSVSAVVVYDAEHAAPDGNIASLGDAFWWASTTMTTVGYGDRYPTTTTGRLTAEVLMLTGIALLGTITAAVAAWFVSITRRTTTEAAEEDTADERDAVTTELQSLRTAVEALTGEVYALRAERADLPSERSPGAWPQSHGPVPEVEEGRPVPAHDVQERAVHVRRRAGSPSKREHQGRGPTDGRDPRIRPVRHGRKLGGGGGKSSGSATTGDSGAGQTVHLTDIVVAAESRALLDGKPDIAYLPVVEVDDVAETARIAGVVANPEGWVRGIRDAVLMPQGDTYQVLLLVSYEDSPGLFGKKDRDTPKGIPIGRLGKRETKKWASAFDGRMIQVVVYLDATPGLDPRAEVRFHPALLEEAETDAEIGTAPEGGVH